MPAGSRCWPPSPRCSPVALPVLTAEGGLHHARPDEGHLQLKGLRPSGLFPGRASGALMRLISRPLVIPAGAAMSEVQVEQFGYHQELKRSLSFWDLLIYGL